MSKTISDRVLILENKDERRDSHYIKLNKQIEELTKSQTQIIELLAGTELNDKKGFVKLVNTIEQKINVLEKQTDDNADDLVNVKWWSSRVGTAIIIGLVGLWIKSIFK